VNARQHLDECGFSRAVFAQQRKDFAAADIQRDVVDRRCTAKGLGHSGK